MADEQAMRTRPPDDLPRDGEITIRFEFDTLAAFDTDSMLTEWGSGHESQEETEDNHAE